MGGGGGAQEKIWMNPNSFRTFLVLLRVLLIQMEIIVGLNDGLGEEKSVLLQKRKSGKIQ
jgi:hypothetical protein